MNYFDELIESYNKLIKRKFSLNENEVAKEGKAKMNQAQAEAAAMAVVTAGKGQEYINPNTTKGIPYAYKVKGTERINLMGITGRASMPLTDDAGNVNKDPGTREKPSAWSKLVNHFMGESEQADADKDFEENYQRAAGSSSPLTDAGLYGKQAFTALEEIKANVAKIVSTDQQLQRSFDSYISPETGRKVTPPKAEHWTEGKTSYSLESKMSRSKEVIIDPKTGAIKEEQVSKELVGAALDSASFISRIATSGEISKEDCEEVTNRVTLDGKGDRQKIIYRHGNDTQRGLVIKPSIMDSAFLARIEKLCREGNPKFELPKLTRQEKGEIKSQSLNGFRGPAIEQLVSFIGLTKVVEKVEDPVAKAGMQDEMRPIIRTLFLDELEKSRQAFDWVLSNEDSAITLESYFKEKYILDASEDLGTPKGIARIMSEINELGKQAFQTHFSPDVMLQTGKEEGVGKKGDVSVGYTGENAEARCIADADRMGVGYETRTFGDLAVQTPEIAAVYQQNLGITDDTQEVFSVPNSLKAYLDFDGYKAGDSTIGNVKNYFNGIDIPPHFLEAIKDELQLGVGGNPTFDEIKEYWSKEIDSIDKLVHTLIPVLDGNYTNDAGEVVKVDPTHAVELIRKKFTSKLTYSKQKESEVLKVITDSRGQLVDLSNKEVRASLQEQLSRLFTTAKMHTDMKNDSNPSKQKKARFAACFVAWAGGGDDADGVTDARDLKERKAYLFPDNAPLRKLTEGIINGSWELDSGETDYYTTRFRRKGEGKGRGAVSLKRTRKKNKRDDGSYGVTTRFSIMVNKALCAECDQDRQDRVAAWDAEGPNGPLHVEAKQKREARQARRVGSEQIEAGVLLSYLKGQQQLLENIVELISD